VNILATRFLIIDGNSLGCRAAFAHNPKRGADLHTKDGMVTGTIYRFLNMMDKICHQLRPTHMVISWDTDKNTFRKQLYPEYKANRHQDDKLNMSTVYAQFEMIRKITEQLGIKNVNVPTFEGDDICGTFAHISKADETFIVTGDKDSFQLVNDHTTIVFPKNGFQEVNLVTEKYIQEKYGVTVSQYIDLKMLQGDTSDNITGLVGCGPKTASKMLNKFGSADKIHSLQYDELQDCGKKILNNIDDWNNRFDLIKTLVTIRQDVELPCTFEDCQLDLLKWEELKPVFEKLELKSILYRLGWNSLYGQDYTGR
jgi:DNA polymerase-1